MGKIYTPQVLDSGTAGVSGLQFVRLTSATASTAGASYAGVDPSGNLVIASTPVGGSKNYFVKSNANSDFEANSVLPWATFSTTLSNGVPTTVTTGGAGAITIATNSASPLSGTYDLVATKPAANVVGTGFISGVLTIEREDLAKVLFGQFSYFSNSANIDASGSSTQSLEIWVYNVVGNYWIQPGGYRGMNTNGSPGKVTYNFQTDSSASNNQYRIAIITAQSSTLGYAVEFDSFALGPQTITTGAAMTDWKAFTPTGTWTTNATYTGKTRRVGDSAEFEIQVNLSGAPGIPTTSFLYINLPVTIDGSKLANGSVTAGVTSLGSAQGLRSGVAYYLGAVAPNDATSITIVGNSVGNFSATVPATWGAGDVISMVFTVPVVGFSSNVQQSSDSDQRTVAAYLNAIEFNPTSGVTAQLQYTAALDTSGGYNPATNLYTVSVSGIYEIITKTIIYSGAVVSSPINHQLLINGTAVQTAIASDVVTASKNGSYSNFGVAANITYLAKLSAGSTIGGNVTQYSGALNTVNSTSFMAIKRLSGSAVVQNTESVNASYTLSLPQSIAATGNTAVAFDIKQYDSHAGFSVANKLYTFPVSGKFHIHGALNYTSTASGFEYGTILVLAGGYTPYQTNSKSGTLNLPCGMSYSFTVTVKAGDTVQLQTFQSSGTALNLRADNSAAALTSLYIERVGN